MPPRQRRQNVGLQSTYADQTLSLCQFGVGRLRGISKYKDSKLDLYGNIVYLGNKPTEILKYYDLKTQKFLYRSSFIFSFNYTAVYMWKQFICESTEIIKTN